MIKNPSKSTSNNNQTKSNNNNCNYNRLDLRFLPRTNLEFNKKKL